MRVPIDPRERLRPAEASRRAVPGTPFRQVEPPRDGSPAKFRRPLAIDPDETDRDDVHRTSDPALCSASLAAVQFIHHPNLTV